jgi:hypothetical protein
MKNLQNSSVFARAARGRHNKSSSDWKSVSRHLGMQNSSEVAVLWDAFDGEGESEYCLWLDERDYDTFLDVLMERPGGAVKVTRAVSRFFARRVKERGRGSEASHAGGTP